MVFIRPLLRYADFSGRARRSEYWGFVLFQGLVGGLLVGTAAISLSEAPQGGGGMGFFTCLALAGVAALAFVVPHLAVTVRRLHDTNRSAWWLLLQAPGALSPLIFFGAALGVAGGGARSSDAVAAALVSAAAGAMLLLMAAQVCNTILMVILWMRGTDGENRYGPDPRSPDGRLDSPRARRHDAGRGPARCHLRPGAPGCGSGSLGLAGGSGCDRLRTARRLGLAFNRSAPRGRENRPPT